MTRQILIDVFSRNWYSGLPRFELYKSYRQFFPSARNLARSDICLARVRFFCCLVVLCDFVEEGEQGKCEIRYFKCSREAREKFTPHSPGKSTRKLLSTVIGSCCLPIVRQRFFSQSILSRSIMESLGILLQLTAPPWFPISICRALPNKQRLFRAARAKREFHNEKVITFRETLDSEIRALFRDRVRSLRKYAISAGARNIVRSVAIHFAFL